MPSLNIQKARAMGATDQQIQQYLAANPHLSVSGIEAPEPVQAPVERRGGGVSDWLPALGSIVGGVAGGALGPVGVIGGGALGGGAGEWLRQVITGSKSDMGSIGKEAALGGVGGVVSKVAAPAFRGARALVAGKKAAPAVATATTKGANVVERLGQSLQKGVAKPKVNPSATAFDDEAELLTAKNKLGIHGAAETQRAQSAIEYKRLIGEMQNRLAINNPPLDPKITKSTVQQAIEGTLNYDPSTPAWNRALTLRMGQVAEQSNVQQLLKYKLDLGKKLGRAFTKIEKGSDLTVQEEAALATWQSIDRIIAQAAPEMKELTTAMSVLHKLAPGLKTSAERGVTLGPLGNIPGVSRVIQGGQDAAGRALEAAGGMQAPNRAGQIVGQTAAQAGTRMALDPGEADAAQEAEVVGESDTLTASMAGDDKFADFAGESRQKQIKQAFAMAMLQNPKQASTLKTIYEFGFAGDSEESLTAAEKTKLNSINQAENMLNSFEQQLETVGLGEGLEATIGGTGKKIAGQLNLNPDAGAYSDLREGLANILSKSLGQVGNLSDKDIKLAIKLIPDLTDDKRRAAIKLKQIRQIISDGKNYIKASGKTPTANSGLQEFDATGDVSSLEEFLQ